MLGTHRAAARLSRRWLITAMVVGLVAALVGPVGASIHDETGYATTAAEYDLLAGQDELAGKVYVWDAFDNVYVQYVAKHGWCILETHVEVADRSADIPQNRGGPIPGQFSQGETFDDCVTLAGHYVFEDAFPDDGNVVVAAHAVVQKTTVIEAAPYFANTVLVADQGVQVDLINAIPAARSNPVAALEQEYPNSPRDDLGFFSLGFKRSLETGFAEAGGSIEVSFECPVIAGEGPDLRIWEVTFGAYPEEKAEVFAWDGADWVSMGFADNSAPGPEGSPAALTVSDFNLPAGLMSTEKIKVVDVTNPALFDGTIGQRRANADGFDLDGIQALQDCTEVQTETAWADGDRFLDKGNWATFASYTQGDGTLVDNSARELTFLVFDLGDSSEDLGGMAWVDGVQQYVAHTVCAEVAGDSAWFTYQIPEGAAFGAGMWVTFKVTAAGGVGYSVGGEAAMVILCQTQANITGGWAGTASGTVIVHP